ncbi:MAG: hypothetical protein M0R06_06225 [Sphaerochaeta sp.]|nr:hypothetical protein [Sphaerochaeta sp.]
MNEYLEPIAARLDELKLSAEQELYRLDEAYKTIPEGREKAYVYGAVASVRNALEDIKEAVISINGI